MEEKETAKLGNDRIIFFLGAGASVPADVPQIVDFTKQFEENIKKKREILEKIKKKYGEINVESLLKALYSSNNENENAFDSSELELLKKELEQFVHEKIVLNGATYARVGGSITKEFINEFVGTIRKNAEALEGIQKILREKRKIVDVDVELLLEALHELNDRGKYVLPDISDLNEKLKGRESELKSLEKELRRFIREKTIVSEDKIGYLAPLKEFVDEYKTLDIFSVNYDTCIEQFCKKHNFTYTDGFELYWNPNAFKNDYKIKLYKIHGSVTWYKTDEGDYIKVPIASEKEDEIELITGEKAKTLMVYPMPGKFEEYSTPRSEFIPILHKKLEEVKFCIVIGYRFRDDEIRTIFFEAAKKASQKNEGLIIFLIAPDAGKIYDDKLKFIDKDKRKPSPLEGRVICWNYPMQKVLEDNYLYQKLETLADIQTLSKEADKIRREGKFAYDLKLHGCVSKCIDIGYASMAEKILKTKLGIAVNNLKESSLFVRDEHNDIFKVLCGLGVNHLYSDRYDKAKMYFKELKVILKESLDGGNEYFELSHQFINLSVKRDPSKEDEEKIRDLKQKLEQIRQNKDDMALYEWFINSSDSRWIIRLQSGFIDILNREINLRSREDVTYDPLIEKLKAILEKCNDMEKLLEIPFNADIYKGSDLFTLDGSHGSCRAETRRKTDAEKKLTEIVNAFEDLIVFCEEKERQTVE